MTPVNMPALITDMSKSYTQESWVEAPGEAPVRLVVEGFPEPMEGIAQAWGSPAYGDVVLFRPYIYERVTARRPGQRDYDKVVAVEEMPWEIDPARIIAVRHADDLPPS